MKQLLYTIIFVCLLPTAGYADDDDYTDDPKTRWIDASREGNLSIIKAMLQKGFDIETKTDSGNSALKIASKKNHIELATFLIDKGAEINSRSHKKDSTPLQAAAKRGNLEIVNLLLRHKADYNIRTHKGNTPLNLAATKNHYKVIKVLLDAGANLESQNDKGQTPLCQAASKNAIESTQILLAQGADPLLVDNDGRNVIQLASGKSSDIVIGTANATAIIIKLSKVSVNDDDFNLAANTVLVNRGWAPEKKSSQEFYASLKKDERLFRIHLKRIGDNLLVEYMRGYGSNKQHYLYNIKHDLLLTLKSKSTLNN